MKKHTLVNQVTNQVINSMNSNAIAQRRANAQEEPLVAPTMCFDSAENPSDQGQSHTSTPTAQQNALQRKTARGKTVEEPLVAPKLF